MNKLMCVIVATALPVTFAWSSTANPPDSRLKGQSVNQIAEWSGDLVCLVQGQRGNDQKKQRGNPPVKEKKPPVVQKKPPVKQKPPPEKKPPTRPPVVRQHVQQPPQRTDWRPRPGQAVIQPNRNWRPDRSHQYNSSIYISINIWNSTTFVRGGRTQSWNPSVWHYWVEDSLVEIVYRSERMSNALRESFERQMNQRGLRSSRGGQDAWDNVQRMDESLEDLRAQLGWVSGSDLRESVRNVLWNAQHVADSFNRHPQLRRLVQYDWMDLQYELNELARYYGAPRIG
jgi:hypothetical protein